MRFKIKHHFTKTVKNLTLFNAVFYNKTLPFEDKINLLATSQKIYVFYSLFLCNLSFLYWVDRENKFPLEGISSKYIQLKGENPLINNK